jgi:plastocyanin
MARTVLTAALAAGTAALAASATTGAAGVSGRSHAANKAPIASLRAKHRRPRVGKKVVLDSSRSRDPDGHIVYHLWDLNGDGVYERDSGRRARIRHAFHKPGKVRVAVVVVDDRGAYSVRRATFRAVRSAHRGRRSARGSKAPAKRRHPLAELPTRKGGRKGRHSRPARRPAVHAAATAVHAAAAANSVTIKGFAFKPESITVNVGDTVVWTNEDTVAHSAVATDGSFDTGLLAKGVTGSYKFAKAGTFSYHCAPHPNMTGTVIVKASGASPSSGSNSNSSNSPSGNSSRSSNLPHTGLQIASVVLAGLLLLGAGSALRRRLTRP